MILIWNVSPIDYKIAQQLGKYKCYGSIILDLSSPISVREYIENNDLSKTDIFVHCAGVNIKAGIDEVNDYNRMLKNGEMVGAIKYCGKILEYMK